MEDIESAVEIEAKKPTVYWMVKLSVVCFVSFVILLVALIVLKDSIMVSDFEKAFIAGFILSALVSSAILAVVSLLKISGSGGLVGGQKFAIVIVVLSTVFMLPAAALLYEDSRFRSISYRFVCGCNLSKLGKALLLYTNDNNGYLPEAQWCDLLIAGGYASPENFICKKSGARLGESSFALNKEVAGKYIGDIPPDMVLLFETNLGISKTGRDFRTKDREFYSKGDYWISRFSKVYKDRWNQISRPESLAIDNHKGDGCNIVFGDTHAKWIRLNELADLRWSLKDNFNFELSQLKQPNPEKIKSLLLFKKVSISVIAIIIVGGAFFSLRRFQFRKYRSFTILLGVTCVIAGLVLGGIGGSVGGLIVGISYFAILTKRFCLMKGKKEFMSYAVALGMAAGMICGVILHLVLMIMAEDKRPFWLITGLSVAIIVGAVMGAVCGAECLNREERNLEAGC